MFKQDVLLAIFNFSQLKSLSNNAKIRSLLKFLLIRYQYIIRTLFKFMLLHPINLEQIQHYMGEILPIWCKPPINQWIDQSIDSLIAYLPSWLSV